MKVNQIVSEHKKGYRAKKYARKPINTIAPKKPVAVGDQPINELGLETTSQETTAPNTPAPTDPASQGTVISQDDKSITVQMPDGTQVKKDLISGVTTDPNGNPVFQAGTTQQAPGTAPQQQQNPMQKLVPGAKIAVNTQPQQQKMGQTAFESADNVLLDKMLTIAGLR